MKRKLIISLVLLLLVSVPSLAQKRPRRTTTTKQPSRPATVTKTPVSDLRAEAEAVAEQLKLLSRFIYLYGRISNGLETAEAQDRRRELSRAQIEQMKKNKEALVGNITSYRAGLDQLSQKIQANPKLQFQHLKLLAASEAAIEAEQFASSGKYDEAGRSLIRIAEKLAEVLAELR